jgi:hypothetical protein
MWVARTSAASPRVEVEARPDEPGLYVEQEERTWGLYLRLPEIPEAGLGTASLSVLQEGFLEVFVGGVPVSRLSALDVRPNVGTARAQVPPTWREYQVVPEGRWPPAVDPSRWRVTIRGLDYRGTLFRLRGGEWVRLRRHSLVRWGEPLLLIAGTGDAPPDDCLGEEGDEVSHGGMSWRLWRVELPSVPEPGVESWLTGLGHKVAPPAWRVSFASVPDSFAPDGQTPRFRRDAVALAKLVPPLKASETMLSLRLGSNLYSRSVRPRATETLFVAVSAGVSAPASLQISSDSECTAELEFVEPPTVEQLRGLLARLPRLRLWIGERCFEAWHQEQALVRRRSKHSPVRIEPGVEGARLSVVVHLRRGRRTSRDLGVREAEAVVSEALAEARRIELDAGALGRVDLVLDVAVSGELTAEAQRVAPWLGVAALSSSSGEGSGQSAFVARRAAAVTNLRGAALAGTVPGLVPHLRALARGRRGRKGSGR